MKSLEQIFKDHGYNTDYDDAKETIRDNEYLLKSQVPDKEDKAYKNLHKFYYGDSEYEVHEIKQIINDYVRCL